MESPEETIKDDALWIKKAEGVAYQNATIMQLLLDKFYVLERLVEFHKAAKSALTLERSNFVSYLKTRVLEKYDAELYIEVHLKSANQTSSLDDFLKVRSLLSVRQEADFIENCKNDKQNLYVDILNNDGDFEKILRFLQDKKKARNTYSFFSYGFDVPKALSYIAQKYPDEVFDIIKFQTEEALGRMKLDRKGYAGAVAYLRPFGNLPKTHHIKVTNYLMVLRSRYAGRPAFLDELGKVGLHLK